ncbi:hypothetical protein ScPMuIL_018571 [Solemya velum]
MQGSDSVWKYSGMQVPPFRKQLQRILSEYPDGDQIIKEIIQNADDAEATEMKICYEPSVIRPDPTVSWSRYFEAPALCFYNDSVFSDKDWEGIRAYTSDNLYECQRGRCSESGPLWSRLQVCLSYFG